MPELPEVETVRRGLAALLPPGDCLVQIKAFRKDLRFPIPLTKLRRLYAQPILGVRRRAKYLLIETPAGFLLSHLGMTGSWRERCAEDARTHDHLILQFASGRSWVYNDARRFGFVDFVGVDELTVHPRLCDLGLEPFDPGLNAEYLRARLGGRNVAVKVALMNQAYVVGVGNIYASEVLFRSGVNPRRLCSRLREIDFENMAREIPLVLQAAIEAGGSTISDYRDARGGSGSFQDFFQVYDREGQPCQKCGAALRAITQAGRSTYFCPRCQK
jgi:formamidopyrimidine-DNA glycosylase